MFDDDISFIKPASGAAGDKPKKEKKKKPAALNMFDGGEGSPEKQSLFDWKTVNLDSFLSSEFMPIWSKVDRSDFGLMMQLPYISSSEQITNTTFIIHSLSKDSSTPKSLEFVEPSLRVNAGSPIMYVIVAWGTN